MLDARHTMHEMQVLDRRDNSKAGLPSPSQAIARRTLKIEPLGDPWRRKLFAGIRLKGRWLVRAGFRPGRRVTVIVSSPGSLQLRIVPESPTAVAPVSGREQPQLALESAGPAEQDMQNKD